MTNEQSQYPTPPELSDIERAAQKKRNMWLGLSLAGFVVLVGLISAVRIIENIGAGA